MQYTTETLNRNTGDIVLTNLGEYLTVTELGHLYDKGPNEIRAILHHMGLLGSEGVHGRYRLAPFAVLAGYGKRIEKSRSKYPFDVLSPACQQLIFEAWDDTVADLETEKAQCEKTCRAKAELEGFCADRGRVLTTEEGVSWLQFHFSGLTNRQIANVLSVSEQLVGRYIKKAAEQKGFRLRMKERVLL
jgi:hypothetical protein